MLWAAQDKHQDHLTVGPSLPVTVTLSWAWREVGWKRGLGFISGKRGKCRGGLIGTLLPVPQSRTTGFWVIQAEKQSALCSFILPAPCLPPPSSLRFSFPQDLQVLGELELFNFCKPGPTIPELLPLVHPGTLPVPSR